jgi:hypothetical protein
MAIRGASSISRLAAVCAALVCLVVVAVEIPTVHEHASGTAGLFNEQCLLERLATAPASAVLPLTLEALEPPPAVRGRALAALLPAPLARPVPPTDPRAPPLA